MEIIEAPWTGSIHNLSETLIRSVAQYTRNYKNVKVGITNNPKRRAAEHARSDIKWKKMVVKYETSSVNFINGMEIKLIDYHWEYLKNKRGGGGGPNGQGPYYLYVLLK